MVERELPEESSAQRIGQLAQLTLGARHPLTWKLKELDGTTDVGLDYQVQVVKAVVTGELNQFRDIFRLQLKGTESPKRSSDGDFYSVDLKASTVRYYERMTEPVLLVLCDLSVFPGDPRACPAFYVWIHDEIRRRRGDGSRAVDNNDYLTFRVPVANVLDGSFDVCSEIERTRTLMKVALQLDKTVEQSRPGMPPEERGAFAHKIIGGFVGRGVALLDAMSEPVSSPWPKAPQGSIAARLITVAEMLQRGNSSGAMAVLEGIRAKVSDAVAVERAEFAFLFGRALTLNGQEADALPYFDQAIALSAEPKHLVAWAEGKLRESLHGGTEGDLSAIRARLTVDHPEVIAMQARLLATEGKHTDAQAMLDRLAGDDVMTTRAIVALNASDWLRVTDICSAGLAKVGCDDRSRSLFSLLRARGLFHIAVGIKEPVEFEKLPVFGPPDLDLAKLRDCWSDIEMTLGFFSEAGWPE
ncbi:MAG: hypothetical protein JWR16_1330, partial [Nevskia sp.]|nr:hypothetical protein [Nevskia sp.]